MYCIITIVASIMKVGRELGWGEYEYRKQNFDKVNLQFFYFRHLNTLENR